MCTPNLMAILWTLGSFEKFEIDFIKFFEKVTKDENFVCGEYIWPKLISIIKYEKWKIYFRCEVIGDIFVWKSRWKMKII